MVEWVDLGHLALAGGAHLTDDQGELVHVAGTLKQRKAISSGFLWHHAISLIVGILRTRIAIWHAQMLWLHEQLGQNAASSPQVHLHAVILIPKEQLWRAVISRRDIRHTAFGQVDAIAARVSIRIQLQCFIVIWQKLCAAKVTRAQLILESGRLLKLRG